LNLFAGICKKPQIHLFSQNLSGPASVGCG